MKNPKILNKLTRKLKKDKRTSVVVKRRTDIEEIYHLLGCVAVVSMVLIGIVFGIMYLVGHSKPAYTYNEGKFELKFTEDVKRYVNTTDVTAYGITTAEPTKYGIEDIMNTYRKPLYKSIGSDGVNKLDGLKYMDVYEVTDDGKELNVLVSLNTEIELGYSVTVNEFTARTKFVNMVEQEKDKFLMAMAYAFKDSRSVHVQFGSMIKDEYNETVFAWGEDSEYVFRTEDLKRIKGWNTYSVDMLKRLNKL